MEGEGFQHTDLGDSQELTNTRAQELTADNLTEVSTFNPAPDDEGEDGEEAVPENKLTLDNLANEGFQLFKTASDFFYDMGPPIIHVPRP